MRNEISMPGTNPAQNTPASTAVWYFVGATFAFVAAVFVLNTQFILGVAAIVLGVLLMTLGVVQLRKELKARKR